MGSQSFDAPRDSSAQVFMFNPDSPKDGGDLIIIGRDTDDGPEHPLCDEESNALPVDLDLVENILLLGKVLEPIAVRKNGDKAEVVYGRGRVLAVREINRRLRAEGVKSFEPKNGRGLFRVPGIRDRSTDAELIKRMYSENTQRRVMSALARARHIQRFLDQSGDEKAACNIFKLGSQQLKSQLQLLDLDKAVQKLVHTGSLLPTAAISLASLPRDEQKAAAEKLIASGATTVAAAKAEVKRSRATKGGGKAEDVVQAPSKRVLRRVVEANAELDDKDQLSEDFIRGIRFALGDISPAAIKGLTALMAPPSAEAAE